MLSTTTGARLTAVYVRDPLESREDGHRKLAATLAAAAAAGHRCTAVVEPPVGITNPGTTHHCCRRTLRSGPDRRWRAGRRSRA